MKNLNLLELATNPLQKIVGYVLMKFLTCQHMKATVSCIRMIRCINRSVSKDRALRWLGAKTIKVFEPKIRAHIMIWPLNIMGQALRDYQELVQDSLVAS